MTIALYIVSAALGFWGFGLIVAARDDMEIARTLGHTPNSIRDIGKGVAFIAAASGLLAYAIW